MSVRYFSGERFICEQKDLDRAKSCTSEAKAMAQLNAITDLDKLFRRGIAFATVGQYGTDPKPWMDKAKQLGASVEDVQRFYQELIKAGKNIDPTNEDMLLAALAMLAAGKSTQQVVSIETPEETPEAVNDIEDPANDEPLESVEPEVVTGEGKTFSFRINPYEYQTENVLSDSDMIDLINHLKEGDRNKWSYLPYKKAGLKDYTLFCILYEFLMNRNDFEVDNLVGHTELCVGMIDFGWDRNIDEADKTCSILREYDEDLEDYSAEHIASGYKTIKFFDYYMAFSNLVAEQLNDIYGWSQECYAGISEGYFIIGFDVRGGSVLMRMPFAKYPEFRIKSFNKSRTQYDFGADYGGGFPVYYRPYSFYGKGDDHFYPTDRKNYLAELDLRLD